MCRFAWICLLCGIAKLSLGLIGTTRAASPCVPADSKSCDTQTLQQTIDGISKDQTFQVAFPPDETFDELDPSSPALSAGWEKSWAF